jgi:hypothetical protein
MRLVHEKLPLTLLSNEIIEKILYSKRLIDAEINGVTLAVCLFIERHDPEILEESEIASALSFDYYDVMVALRFLEEIGYLKINSN